MHDYIKIKNARIHNLKNIDIRIPRGKLTVITGVSGSGKSSLAFDTLYEEGKRRYLMFSGTQFMVDSAPVFDSMTGLSPTVAVEQRVIRQSNPRSTVGTRTKISNMLAVMFAAYGERDDDGIPLSMEMFLKNSPKGMCVKCLGAGTIKMFDDERLFEDKTQRIDEVVFGIGKRGVTRGMVDKFCKYHDLSIDRTLASLTPDQLHYLKYGDNGASFMGFVPWCMRIINNNVNKNGRLKYLMREVGYLHIELCPRCGGTGLGEQAAHTKISGKTITELESMYIGDLLAFMKVLSEQNPTPLCREIITKLDCMSDVGLRHLALSRPVPTLSGGEIQRLFLASYIIADMDSIIFIFDEPTIGLHEIEKEKLISIIRALAERGNTVVTVEHDENFMRHADYIIDLGPYAGTLGGQRIFQGSFDSFIKCKASITAPYLSKKDMLPVKIVYKPIDSDRLLGIRNANLHNLQNVSVDIPLGLMVGVAGVSGSGKSSLIADTLVPKLKEMLKSKCVIYSDETDKDASSVDVTDVAASEDDLETVAAVLTGVEHIKECHVIDQKPIGRSRTSCPATYTGMFDRIRALFAKTPDALTRGYTAGFFTVNSDGGCNACKGDGVIHYHVGFGNFIEITCEDCKGTGFIPEIADIRLDGRNICEILDMTVDEAFDFFADKDKGIHKVLATLRRVGMGYIKLGQKTPTISGGESQRIKLAKELSKGRHTKNSLYILDEPTTGLSFHDIKRLLEQILELVDGGNTVLVTEHDPYVLSNCDYIIEMGIGGGADGGDIIASGTPRELKDNANSIIGRYLK